MAIAPVRIPVIRSTDLTAGGTGTTTDPASPSHPIEQLRVQVQQAINGLVNNLNKAAAAPQDTQNQRITRVLWPAEQHDAVNVEYLQDQLGKKKKIASVAGGGNTVDVAVAYVDEPECAYLYGTLSSSTGTADPVTILSTWTSTTTMTLTTGDHVMFNDVTQDPNHTSFRAYEIGQITAIAYNGGGTATSITINRAKWGSFATNHLTGIVMYKVHVAHFALPASSIGVAGFTPYIPRHGMIGIRDVTGITGNNIELVHNEGFVLPSACAMSVAAGKAGSAFTTVNCSQIAYPYSASPPGTLTPPAPGFRTANGAEYLLQMAGTATASQAFMTPLWVPEAASIKNVVAVVRASPSGSPGTFTGALETVPSATLAGYAFYISPRDLADTEAHRQVGLIEQLTFTSDFDSFVRLNDPVARRTPYNLLWPTISFPKIGTLGDIIDASTGNWLLGTNPTTSGTVLFQEGGAIGFAYVQVGTTVAGADLLLSVLT